MKRYITISIFCLIAGFTYAQTINWASFSEENKQIINLNGGLNYGVNFGLGYGFKTNTQLFPNIATIDYSSPSGEKPFDDFKVRIGAQTRWFEVNNFQFSTRIQGVFRRFSNDYTRLLNFGSDMAGTFGYYRPKWFLAAEIGFDKAIVTHFRHTNTYKIQYPKVEDGWYEPATGGNFYYGLQTGFSLKRTDMYCKAGRILVQNFKSQPMLPFFAELGLNQRF